MGQLVRFGRRQGRTHIPPATECLRSAFTIIRPGALRISPNRCGASYPPLDALVEAEAMLDRGVSVSGRASKQTTPSFLDIVAQPSGLFCARGSGRRL